jgi:hypothetical protein
MNLQYNCAFYLQVFYFETTEGRCQKGIPISTTGSIFKIFGQISHILKILWNILDKQKRNPVTLWELRIKKNKTNNKVIFFF